MRISPKLSEEWETGLPNSGSAVRFSTGSTFAIPGGQFGDLILSFTSAVTSQLTFRPIGNDALLFYLTKL